MEIFGRGSDWVGPITEPEQEIRRQEERIDPGSMPVDYIWPKANVFWESLAGAVVGPGYLVNIDVS